MIDGERLGLLAGDLADDGAPAEASPLLAPGPRPDAPTTASEPRTFAGALQEAGLSGRLAAARQRAALLAATLAGLGLAAFVCDARGVVCALTPAAEAALKAGRLRLVKGRPSAPDAYDAAGMEAALLAAVGGDRAGTWTAVNRHRREPTSVQVIDIIGLPRDPPQFGFEPRAIVVLRGGERNRAELELILADGFGLTAAEAEVAARVADGQRREAIAAERGVSVQTVRSQLKHIFAKLNVGREAELVAMLAAITRR